MFGGSNIMILELNDHQKKAVGHYEGPMMVLAGPGSGKTMVITYRLKNLIQKHQIAPNRILVITFTKAASLEMKQRFEHLAKEEGIYASGVNFGTFHAVFFRILRGIYGYTVEQVLREEEKEAILRELIRKEELSYEDEQDFLMELQTEISLMKNELMDLSYYHAMCCSTEVFRHIVTQYERKKHKLGKIDFDDMICLCYETLKKNPSVLSWWQKRFQYILIDEFQDINRSQYETIKMLAAPENHLFVVGDDDQSIYKFRGARPEFLLQFPKDFPHTQQVILDVNYRSTQGILEASYNVIKNNQQRYEKKMKAIHDFGKKPILLQPEDSQDEAALVTELINKLHQKGVPLEEMAVLFRTNLQARAFIDLFLDYHLPFYLRDETPNIYDHWIAKDIEAYFQLCFNIHQNEYIQRIINKPKRYISKGSMVDAKKRGGSIIDQLYQSPSLKSWQLNRLEELQFHLQQLAKKKAKEGIRYIRNTIGYQEFLVEYSEYRNIDSKGLREILDELQEGAREEQSIEDWLSHVQAVRWELAQRKQAFKYNKTKQPGITLSTLHGAKGLEFQVVFITGAVEGVLPHEKSMTPSELEEERRLFYVGMTRAKKTLYISHPQIRYEEKADPSRFIDELLGQPQEQDFQVGTRVFHQRYGEGKIKNRKNQIIDVKFKNHWKQKKIDLHYCLQEKLIESMD